MVISRLRKLTCRIGQNESERRLCVSYAASTLVHVCILALLTCLWSAADGSRARTVLTTDWISASDEPRAAPVPVQIVNTALTPDSRDASNGGGSASTLFPTISTTHVRRPATTISPLESREESRVRASLLTDVGEAPLGGAKQAGTTEGTGSGAGEGDGEGFFGIKTDGASFVFVVDGSRSMNHPHPGPAKTRFKRLKLEIIKSVGKMRKEQNFFIIFFNDQAYPMPARSLQPATAASQKKYLYWMSELRADGQTDPEAALSLALRLKPEVIYFLTDGEFEFRVQRRLLQLKQEQTQIHTYVFGETKGEDVMQTIAAQNGGKYVFIP